MSNIENWDLWKLFEKKGCSDKFRVAVEKVCEKGINLSKTIMLTFPNFTLHDETHIHNVCDWMCKLLSDEEKNNLTAIETAMLLMSACCHDIGMCVFKNQKEKLLNNVSTPQWKKYFERFPQDYSKINDKNEQDRIIRNFIRIYHHERVREALGEFEWSDDLKSQSIYLQDLTDLCKSHGESLNDLKSLSTT